MKISVSRKISSRPGCLVTICSRSAEGTVAVHSMDEAVREAALRLAGRGDYEADDDAPLSLYDTAGIRRLVLAGLDRDTPPFAGESARRLGALLVKTLEQEPSVEIDLTDLDAIAAAAGCRPETVVLGLAEGAMLGGYRFNRYRTREEKKHRRPKLSSVRLVTRLAGAAGIAAAAVSVCEATLWARDLVNEPSNALTARALAGEARAAGRKHGFSVRALDRAAIEKLGLRGLLAVNAGSEEPPRLIVAEYRPAGARGTVLLVGKAVMFDTGGVSLKNPEGMGDMKGDMAGGAAVLGAVRAAADLKLPVHLVAVVPATDNKPDGRAQNPGDIIRMHNGVTVEVISTDAEGRLILADALSWGIATNRPDLALDLATLTGACVIALGHRAAAVMTEQREVADLLVAAGEATFERAWPLPLYEDWREQIKSPVADIKNTGGRPGGTLTAGIFLRQFTGDTPWAHIDVAGPTFLDAASHYLPKGGTGYGVRLLVEFLRRWIERG